LTYPQYLVLVVLGGAGPCPIKELAGTLRLDHATLTPMLRRMEEADLVARDRDPDDARVVRLALTEHAARIHAAFDQIQGRIGEDLGLAPEEARRLQLMLRDVATSVERALAPAD
jgi:DNA-binding MarR family transcriptional regulator